MNRLILLFIFCSFVAAQDFGYISYTTTNIGDDIQALAAKRFLPETAIPIDRDELIHFHSDQIVKTVMNGWFLWQKGFPLSKSWPPNACIDPLLISMHITKDFAPEFFSDESIEYLKRHGPVGARDLCTLERLQQKGIPAYFSGCLTLTLQNDPNPKRNNVIYAVDLDEETINYIRSRTKSKVLRIHHGMFYRNFTNEQRLQYASKLLDKYKKAKCVVTTRLHACLPCLALETPVLLIPPSANDPRFPGLIELTHHCSKGQLLSGEWNYNFDDPPENPKDYILIRNNLIHKMESWVAENSN